MWKQVVKKKNNLQLALNFTFLKLFKIQQNLNEM